MWSRSKHGLLVVALIAAWGYGVSAQRGSAGVAQTGGETPGIKAPQELVDLMKANTVILGVDGRGGNIVGRLGEHIRTDNFEAIVGDAQGLKPNLEKITAYFTEQKMEDAVGFARAGTKALGDLEAAAKARDKRAVGQAQIELATACRNCHLARRVMIMRVPLQYEIARNK